MVSGSVPAWKPKRSLDGEAASVWSINRFYASRAFFPGLASPGADRLSERESWHHGTHMSLSIDARTFRELLADPALAETLSAVTGSPLITIEVPDAAEARRLNGLDITAVPAVVVVVANDPACLPPAAAAAADVILTQDDGAGAPFVAPPGGPAAGIARLDTTLAANPVAGTTLALHLRSSAGLNVPAGLVAESAAYSALQDGAEFRRWRASRPNREPDADTRRVRVERPPGELRITLARPARRNAVDWRMRDALADALATAVAAPGIGVLLLGDGPDFCAGGDLDEFGSRPDPALAHLIRLTRSPAMLIHRLRDRATACLHGACLGAGIELPAFAGRVCATADTQIGLPEIGLGLMPGAGGTVSLPRRIGRWRTAFMALTGDCIGARQALRWGLIDAIDDGAPTAGPPGR
jgi:enoyl-CoA hydratase/carnithine racemase